MLQVDIYSSSCDVPNASYTIDIRLDYGYTSVGVKIKWRIVHQSSLCSSGS